jgi:pantothenate kinase
VIDEALARIEALRSGKRRVLVGVAGCPGAGKSTLAAELVEALGSIAAVVPMDGFHLADAELVRRGWRARKGAPHTFDVSGYVALLRRVRDELDRPVYAPRFDRQIEDSIAAAICVEPDVEVVITEGNYLLLDTDGWELIAPLLDARWFVDLDDELRLARLIARHIEHGTEPAEARAWATGTDELNSRLISRTRHRADWIITVNG